MTKKTYVVGNNVSKSLSPTIFNYWFKKYNIDGKYGYLEIKNDKLFEKEILNLVLSNKELVGFNVTIPYKEKIVSVLSSKKHKLTLSNHCQNIGAINFVNIIQKPDSVSKGMYFEGDNTDVQGFEASLNQQINLIKNKAIVIGFGGASKAIIYSLILQGFKNINIFNRNFKKLIKELDDWKKKIYLPVRGYQIKPNKLEDLKKYIGDSDLIVNTTPINILGNLNTWNINRSTIGFDIVYRPKEGTGFLNHFAPNKRIEGIQMLAHQAAPCFKLWFGVEPEVDECLFKHLYKKLEEIK